jgi:hypothetical protein
MQAVVELPTCQVLRVNRQLMWDDDASGQHKKHHEGRTVTISWRMPW